MSTLDPTILTSIAATTDPKMLQVIEAMARAKAENIKLKREHERLVRRIAEEDKRLGND